MKADKKPIVIVAGLILKNGKLLCIRQDKGPYKGFIQMPAGHLEPKESLKKGVVREVKEETGLDVKAKKLILKTEFCSQSSPYYSQLFYFYLCDVIGGKLSTRGEIKEIFWLDFNKILKLEKAHPLLYLVGLLSIHEPYFYRGISD
jgi:ADP-ribose pyrophosphatase YjhB (NUDIX family)